MAILKNYIQFVLEAALYSARFGEIIEVEENSEFRTRANTNALLIAPPGSDKTTNLISISNNKISVYANDTTRAGMIGSINDRGQFTPGLLIQSAGRCLILDEFRNIEPEVKLALNNLIERNEFTRNLGWSVAAPIRIKRKNISLKVKNGWISLKVNRISCITSTMFQPKKNIVEFAWVTRFVPLRFTPSVNYYFNLLRGETAFKIELTKEPKDIDTFIFNDHLKAVSIYESVLASENFINSYFEQNEEERGLVPRMYQNLVRLAAYRAFLDDRNEITINDFIEVADNYFNTMFLGYITSNLDMVDMIIIQGYANGLSQEQIADHCRSHFIPVNQSTISRRMSWLKQKGLIDINNSFLNFMSRIQKNNQPSDKTSNSENKAF